MEEGEGRRWNDHGSEWVGREGKKDGFVSTLMRMVSMLPEGKPLWGRPCRKMELEEADVRPTGGKWSENDPEDSDTWEKEICRAGAGGAFVFSDGSLLEGGNIGEGASTTNTDKQEQEVIYGVGTLATVWDGEIAGMAEDAHPQGSHYCCYQEGRQDRESKITPAEEGGGRNSGTGRGGRGGEDGVGEGTYGHPRQ